MRAVALALSLAALAGSALAQDDALPECVELSGEARYDGTGYLHIVRLRNGCDRAAACEVWTSVDAERLPVRVASGSTAEVIARRGSPAYAFTPHARCTLGD